MVLVLDLSKNQQLKSLSFAMIFDSNINDSRFGNAINAFMQSAKSQTTCRLTIEPMNMAITHVILYALMKYFSLLLFCHFPLKRYSIARSA